jgi:hypothetical protein
VRDFHRVRVCTPTGIETCLIHALFVAVLIVSGSTVAHAAAAPAWAAECAALDEDAARLACYDSHSPPRKNAAKAQSSAQQTTHPQTSAPQTTTPQAATPQPAAPQSSTPQNSATQNLAPPVAAKKDAPPAVSDDFGLTEPRKRESEAAKPVELVANVASVSKKLTGELLLKLDNGQSWVQAQRKPGTVLKAGERVSIARGAFGGYLLRSDSGATFRVRRLE